MDPGSSTSKQGESQRLNENVLPDGFPPIFKAIPSSYTKVPFSELEPSYNSKNKYILGIIAKDWPLQPRPRNSFLRKFLLIDALDQRPESARPKLTIFILDKFAKHSVAATKGDYLAISNFVVENLTLPSQDSLMMQIQVYLDGSNSQTDDSMGQQLWVIQKKILSNNGVGKPDTASKEVTAESSKGQIEPVKSPPGARSKKKSKNPVGPVEESPSRCYSYTNLSAVFVLTGDDNFLYNVYGVVDDCHVRTSSGSSSQILKLNLCDRTRSHFHCAIFRKKNDGAFPDIHIGDIVRIHRLKVKVIRHVVRGTCVSHTFLVVFEKNDREMHPKSTAVSFVYTDDDKQKVKSLFQWAEQKNLPKLISDLKPGEDLPLVVQVIGVFVSRNVDCVTLKIWDGTKNNNCESKHLNLREEKIDPSLYNVAKNHFINLFAYGDYCFAAGQLEPGQYIYLRRAHLKAQSNDRTNKLRLIISSPPKAGRGIVVLKDDDPQVQDLKSRLKKVTEEITAEKEKEASSQNFYLNCDISTMTNTQINNMIATPASSNQQSQIPDSQNSGVSDVGAAAQPDENSQWLGGIDADSGEKRKAVNGILEKSNDREPASSKRRKTDHSKDVCSERPAESQELPETENIPETPVKSLASVSQTSNQSELPVLKVLTRAQRKALATSIQAQPTAPGTSVQAQPTAPGTSVQAQPTASGTSIQAQSTSVETSVQAQIPPPEIPTNSQGTAPEIPTNSQGTAPEISTHSQLTASETSTHSQSATLPPADNLLFTISQQTTILNTVNQRKPTTGLATTLPRHTEYARAQPINLQHIEEISFSPEKDDQSRNWWKSMHSVSVTDGHSHISPLKLCQIVEYPPPYMFRTEAIVLRFKPETECINELIRLYCPSCHYISHDAKPNLEVCHSKNNIPILYCPKCRITCPKEGRLLEYTYLIDFHLHDGTGPECFEAFLWRHNAVKFFKGISPEEALINKNAATSVLEMMWKVCPTCCPHGGSSYSLPKLDCCIKSYTAGGVTRYQIFDTIVL